MYSKNTNAHDGVRTLDSDVKQIVTKGTALAKKKIQACLEVGDVSTRTLSGILNESINEEALKHFQGNEDVVRIPLNSSGPPRWMYVYKGVYGVFLKGAHKGKPCNVQTHLQKSLVAEGYFDVKEFGELQIYTYGYKHDALRSQLLGVDLFQADSGGLKCIEHIYEIEDDQQDLIDLQKQEDDNERKEPRPARWKSKDNGGEEDLGAAVGI